MNKKSYLCCDDYGSGGIWIIFNARSKEEITQKFPMLVVVDVRPAWMSQERYDELAANSRFDIDDPAPKWLQAIREQWNMAPKK